VVYKSQKTGIKLLFSKKKDKNKKFLKTKIPMIPTNIQLNNSNRLQSFDIFDIKILNLVPE